MSRLVTFGCSFTVGVGLPDVYPRFDIPSNMGWPTLLAEKLNLEIVNKGVGASGNLEILYNILNTDLEKTDTVVVMWSSFLRHDRFIIGSEFDSGNRMKEAVFVRDVFKIDVKDWRDSNRNKNWLTIHHASCYLKQLGLKFYTLLGIYDGEQITGRRPKNLDIPNFIEDINPKHWIIDEALDRNGKMPAHPGLESQRLLSELLYDRIK